MAGIALTFGLAAFVLSAITLTLPVPLVLLWLSADVLRSDEWAELAAAENPVAKNRRISDEAPENAAFGLRRDGTRAHVA